MTYNVNKMQLNELTRALGRGDDVRWSNDGYRVHWDNDVIMVTYTQNGFCAALHANELPECYVKGQSNERD